MSNDKQDRKLLAQLAAGYMASTAHPAYDGLIDNMIQDSVDYAIGALAAIDAHLETRRAAEVQAVLDSAPVWAEWRMMEDGAEHLIDTRSGKIVGRTGDPLWHAAKYPGDIHEAYGNERGDLAKAEIIRAVQWKKWEAHGAKVLAARTPAPAELPETSTEPSATEILACAREIETGQAAAALAKPIEPAPEEWDQLVAEIPAWLQPKPAPWRDLVDEPVADELPETD